MRLPDVECPYCGKGQEINHDDGYGFEEGERHEQACGACEKTFVYETFISFDYAAHKAPCLNGAPHRLRERKSPGWPEEEVCLDCSYHKAGRYCPPPPKPGGTNR